MANILNMDIQTYLEDVSRRFHLDLDRRLVSRLALQLNVQGVKTASNLFDCGDFLQFMDIPEHILNAINTDMRDAAASRMNNPIGSSPMSSSAPRATPPPHSVPNLPIPVPNPAFGNHQQQSLPIPSSTPLPLPLPNHPRPNTQLPLPVPSPLPAKVQPLPIPAQSPLPLPLPSNSVSKVPLPLPIPSSSSTWAAQPPSAHYLYTSALEAASQALAANVSYPSTPTRGVNVCALCAAPFTEASRAEDAAAAAAPWSQLRVDPRLTCRTLTEKDPLRAGHSGLAWSSVGGSVVRLQCGHAVCACCLASYVRANVAAGVPIDIPCPASITAPQTLLHRDAAHCVDTHLVEHADHASSPARRNALPAMPCAVAVGPSVLEAVLDQATLSSYQEATLRAFMVQSMPAEQQCTCPTCNTRFYAERPREPPLSAASVGADGQPLTRAALVAAVTLQVRCPRSACDVSFCRDCRATPFHTGQTCAEHQRAVPEGKCRFCARRVRVGVNDLGTHTRKLLEQHSAAVDDALTRRANAIRKRHALRDAGDDNRAHKVGAVEPVALPELPPFLQRHAPFPWPLPAPVRMVCDGRARDGEFESSCPEHAYNVCLRTLPCGCFCNGVRGEAPTECPPCLRCEAPELGEELCPVCHTDALCEAPIICSGTHTHSPAVERLQCGGRAGPETPGGLLGIDAHALETAGVNGHYVAPGHFQLYPNHAANATPWASDEMPPLTPYLPARKVCGHYMHLHCVEERLRLRWHKGRITFRYKDCPVCYRAIFHPRLAALLSDALAVEQCIVQRAVERLHEEGMAADPRLKDKSSDYYEDPVALALASFAFYECFQCKKPYFAGAVECQGSDEEEVPPESLLCPSCGPSVQGACEKHGIDALQFKCKFCCKPSAFSCWGNTYFCKDCHVSGVWQQLAEHRTGKNRKQVWEYPQCVTLQAQMDKLRADPKFKAASLDRQTELLGQLRADPHYCELGVAHPPSGFNFVIGCTLCSSEAVTAAATAAKPVPTRKGYKNKPAPTPVPSAAQALLRSHLFLAQLDISLTPFQRLGLWHYLRLLRITAELPHYRPPTAAFYSQHALEYHGAVGRLPPTPPRSEWDLPPARWVDAAPLQVAHRVSKDRVTFTFAPVSEGHPNGVFFFLGSLGYSQPWTNPHELGLVECSSTRLGPDSLPVQGMLHRAHGRFVLQAPDTDERWLQVDLKMCRLAARAYTLRHYCTMHDEFLRSWVLEASNTGASWVVLMSHDRDLSLFGANASYTWTLPASAGATAYQFFRVRATKDAQLSSQWFPAMGLELYGTLELPTVAELMGKARHAATQEFYRATDMVKASPSPGLMLAASTLLPSALHAHRDFLGIGMSTHPYSGTAAALKRARSARVYEHGEGPAGYLNDHGNVARLGDDGREAGQLSAALAQLTFAGQQASAQQTAASAVPPTATPIPIPTPKPTPIPIPIPVSSSSSSAAAAAAPLPSPSLPLPLPLPARASVPVKSPAAPAPAPREERKESSPASLPLPIPVSSSGTGPATHVRDQYTARFSAASPDRPLLLATLSAPAADVLPHAADLPAGLCAHIAHAWGGPVVSVAPAAHLHVSSPYQVLPGSRPLAALVTPAAAMDPAVTVAASLDHTCLFSLITETPAAPAESQPAITVDLGVYRMQLTAYAVAFPVPSTSSPLPTAWVLEGCEGTRASDPWLPLVTHGADGASAAGRSGVFSALHTQLEEAARGHPEHANRLFRFLRLRITAPNARWSDGYYWTLALRALEFYGQLHTTLATAIVDAQLRHPQQPLSLAAPPAMPAEAVVSPMAHCLASSLFQWGFAHLSNPAMGLSYVEASGGASNGCLPYHPTAAPASAVLMPDGAMLPLPPGLSFNAALSVPGLCVRTFTYQHAGDQNGLLYYMGTRAMTRPFENPAGNPHASKRAFEERARALLPAVDLDQPSDADRAALADAASLLSHPEPPTMSRFAMAAYSSRLADNSLAASAVCGREAVRCVTDATTAPNPYFVVDLGPYTRLVPSAYTLRHYASQDEEALRSWLLLGSLDGVAWEPVAAHYDDRALTGRGTCAAWLVQRSFETQFPQYATPTRTSTADGLPFLGYRFFMALMTGANSHGNAFLALSGIELYGNMVSSSARLSTVPFPAAVTPPQELALRLAARAHCPVHKLAVPMSALPAQHLPALNTNAHNPDAGIGAATVAAHPVHRALTYDAVSFPAVRMVVPPRREYECPFLGKPFAPNGVVGMLGSAFFTLKQFTCPTQTGTVAVVSSVAAGEQQGQLDTLLTGKATHVVVPASSARREPFVAFDMAVHVRPTHYSLRHGTSEDRFLRHWVFEGSADGLCWVSLATHANDTTLANKSQPHAWPLAEDVRCNAYRFFRVRMLGPNASGTMELVLGGWDLYGTAHVYYG